MFIISINLKLHKQNKKLFYFYLTFPNSKLHINIYNVSSVNIYIGYANGGVNFNFDGSPS